MRRDLRSPVCALVSGSQRPRPARAAAGPLRAFAIACALGCASSAAADVDPIPAVDSAPPGPSNPSRETTPGDTPSANGLWLEAERAAARGELEHALELLETQRSRGGDDPQRLELLSRVHLRLGDSEKALSLADRAIARAPRRSSAHLARTRALQQWMVGASSFRAMMRVGELDESTARALELAPESVEALVARGRFRLFAPSLLGGDAGAVRSIVARLEPLDPVQAAALDTARIHRGGDVAGALARCRAGLERHPDAQALQFLRGRLLSETGERKGAATAYRAALSGPDDASRYQASYKLAKLLIQDGRGTEEALALLDDYLAGLRRTDLRNSAAAALLWIGRAHEQAGRSAEARAAFEQALERNANLEQARTALRELEARERDS